MTDKIRKIILNNNPGNWFFDLRFKNDIRLKEVSEKIGISMSLITKIECGDIILHIDLIKPVAELFGVSIKTIKRHVTNDKRLIRCVCRNCGSKCPHCHTNGPDAPIVIISCCSMGIK